MPLLALQSRTSLYSYADGARTLAGQTFLLRGWHIAKISAVGIALSVSAFAGTYTLQHHNAHASAIEDPSVPAITSNQADTARQLVPIVANEVDQSPSAPAASTKPDAAALQQVLADWQQSHSGQFGVVVQELGGLQRSASLQPDVAFPTASLYKMFLAFYAYSLMNQGKFTVDDTLGMPSTVGVCLQRIIVYSDNVCGDNLAYKLGWTNLSNFLHAAGFNETSMSPKLTTTAKDAAKFLEQLQAGTLGNESETQSLLSNMQVQKYRSAIPAGVPGITVADKTGDIDNIWNDAAVVYHPNGNYILVVLSTNSGPQPIADLSHRISDFMNQ